MSLTLQERIAEVEERVARACAASGRDRNDVKVIAVTKYVSLEMVSSVLEAGLEHVAESRWQDAEHKWKVLGDKGTWHFIGHLQTNKVKDVIGKFQYIHSLDRMSLAQELHKKALAADQEVNVFLQVNISGEDTKFGLSPEAVPGFLREIASLDRVKVIGLMTMAPLEGDPELTRPVFRGLRELRDELNQLALTPEPITELSMGMSNDFEVAIQEGATWVRLGTVLVGH
ncbi:YggS family pyridoxal phosphate enzyme [Paenibacillus odorifer]|uniref:Pyridoxal phosphate homeostasis protein n=1 Tax=Paenibacillus odorifer TaxID=189426 RepID=A0A1R0YYK8_9BACL|nr:MULTISPECIES: YggS family pyridoxal phosphate-dependent enzyme [Paenibacillus]ETT56402.1 alanine racemase domain-containing protein [Paenibacillus sp. FSL H8-237]MDH6429933.1 pyridoxal phosphate enzyme (YggS family) [Paenibacillus sp. PastH-4]MDH6445965.1 pyridoxal phosphate enzyme (YggS family) [Paenibacillus sp. PastF-4]MDH6530564.1 pyridoxal phosphate enzyme (YggS family) [Paenibacillus sp. PastH-3]OMC72940.1 YggS family pyridoxal phosphate enzyme [Paenibacillus odorifer]